MHLDFRQKYIEIFIGFVGGNAKHVLSSSDHDISKCKRINQDMFRNVLPLFSKNSKKEMRFCLFLYLFLVYFLEREIGWQ